MRAVAYLRAQRECVHKFHIGLMLLATVSACGFFRVTFSSDYTMIAVRRRRRRRRCAAAGLARACLHYFGIQWPANAVAPVRSVRTCCVRHTRNYRGHTGKSEARLLRARRRPASSTFDHRYRTRTHMQAPKVNCVRPADVRPRRTCARGTLVIVELWCVCTCVRNLFGVFRT